jgi:hypothetical protein
LELGYWNNNFIVLRRNYNCQRFLNIVLRDRYQHFLNIVRFEVFAGVTMKNSVFWNMRNQFVLHRRHITSPLQISSS